MIVRSSLMMIAMMLSLAATAAAQLQQPPAQWLDDHITARQANGYTVAEVLPDVVTMTHPTADLTEYAVRIDGPAMTRDQWQVKAQVGRSYPDPRLMLRRLAKGLMLYEPRLAPNWHWADDMRSNDDMFDRYEARREEVFSHLHEQGINTVVYLTYMAPDRWARLRQQADRYDIDVIIQYLTAYYHPTARPDLWGDPVRSGQIRQQAIDFLRAVWDDGGQSRLLGFAIREEPYLPFLDGVMEYHDLLRQTFPDLRIYMLYNRVEPMYATRDPAPWIMGHNTSEFLGSFMQRNRPEPAPFRTPQLALLATARRLRTTAKPAMLKGAIYTYTGLLAGWMKNESAEDVAQYGWPTGGRIGIHQHPDGRVRFWRVYSPPQGATRASMWTSVAYNALGWFPWSGQWAMPWMDPDEHWRPDVNTDPDHVHSDQRPRWREYLESLNEISRFEKLLLQLRLDGLPRVACDDPLVVATNLRVMKQPGLHRVIVLVNLDVGRWPGYPDVNLVTGENLDISDHGELLHFQPLTEPRDVTFTVRMTADEQLRDLRTGNVLEPTRSIAPGLVEFTASVTPGGAALLFVGQERHWQSIRPLLP